MLQRTPAHPQPVIFLHGVKRHSDVAAVLNFMYRGEVNVGEGDIAAFLAVAEDLKVRGLTRDDLKVQTAFVTYVTLLLTPPVYISASEEWFLHAF